MTTTVLVPFASSSVGQVRRAFATDLRKAGTDRRTIEDAVLVLSEILSNALKHARPLSNGKVQVSWSLSASGVELQVVDGGGPTRPRAASAAMSATGGRGLSIVTELARDWGVSDEGGRTTVWATLTVSRADRPVRFG